MGDGFQEIWVMIDGERFRVRVEDINQRPVIAYVEDSRFEIEIEEDSKGPEATDPLSNGTDIFQAIPTGTSSQVTAPMPGDITQVHVKKGQAVKSGRSLMCPGCHENEKYHPCSLKWRHSRNLC